MRQIHQFGAAAVMLALLSASAHAATPEAQQSQTPAPEVSVPPSVPPDASTPDAAAPDAPVSRLPQPGTAPEVAQAPSGGLRAPGHLSPMMQDIHTLVQQEQAAIEALRARLEQTRDPSEQLQLQREVEQTKRESLWSIMEVQIRYARSEGRTQAAEELAKGLNIARQMAAGAQAPTTLLPLTPQSGTAPEPRDAANPLPDPANQRHDTPRDRH